MTTKVGNWEYDELGYPTFDLADKGEQEYFHLVGSQRFKGLVNQWGKVRFLYRRPGHTAV